MHFNCSRQKKRHEREEKEKQRLVQAKKAENARLSEVYRIKSIQKDIARTEKKQKVRLAKIIEKKIAHEKFGQKKLGKHKYKELSLNPTLSDELSGRLVSTTPQTTLLEERFNSLQKRNILEPRVKSRIRRKLRLKKYQRISAKMEWEKTGVWNGIKVL
jgi:nucleolar protein 53